MRSPLYLLPLLAACDTSPVREAEANGSAARVLPSDDMLTCAAMACPPEAHCELESRWYLDPTRPEGRKLDAIHVATCVMDGDEAEPTG